MDDSFVSRLSESARNVLVVDDEPIILKALDKFLSRYQYNVFKADHAVDALKILRETDIGVIITDYQMPMLSGLEFLQQAKTIQPFATRILITAIQDNATVVNAINDGEIFRFITKPWKGEELIATIHNAAQKYDLLRNNEVLQKESLEANKKLKEQLKIVEAQKNELLESIENSVKLSLKVVESYHSVLGDRAREVQRIALILGQELELDANQLQQLRIASLVHEIGMVSMARDLIKKWETSPGSLTPEEQKEIEHYPVLSEEMAAYVDSTGETSKIVRQHCENFDGTGFPDQLQGQYTHLLARIISVSSFLARGWDDPNRALDLLQAASGKRFDPDVVRAAIRTPIFEHGKNEPTTREVLVQELEQGMILAEPIVTHEGTLLIRKGEKLTQAFIQIINNHNNLSNIRSRILIESRI